MSRRVVLAALVVLAQWPAFTTPVTPRAPRAPRTPRARVRASDGVEPTPSDSEHARLEPERSRGVQLWGVLGVATYLSYGVKKVVPIVRDGVAAITSPWQWLMLAGTRLDLQFIEGMEATGFIVSGRQRGAVIDHVAQ